MISVSREELGNFLRSRRQQLKPATDWSDTGRRRRTPGLRREEVAELAGIGVDWYIRLEQGRNVSPSVTTIDALARALRLNEIEHAHLRMLARSRDHRSFERESVPEELQRMLTGMAQPAYITGRRWDVLAWNSAAAATFTDFGSMAQGDRNILLFMMLDPHARRLFGSAWTNHAKSMVAQFRVIYDQWAADPAFVDIVQRLLQGNRDFVRWWDAHDVGATRSGKKTLHHPKKGVLHFDHASFQSNDNPALKLVVYTLSAVS